MPGTRSTLGSAPDPHVLGPARGGDRLVRWPPFFDHVVANQLIHRRLVPDDLSSGVLYLCSPGAAMVTGQVLDIDGGGVTY